MGGQGFPRQDRSDMGMYYKYGGSFIGTVTETNRFAKEYREGKAPFVVNQSIWFEGEARFVGIIHQANHRIVAPHKKCIEPLGESKSHRDISAAVCDRMGVYDEFMMGRKTDYDWVKDYFHATDSPTNITWDDVDKKGLRAES